MTDSANAAPPTACIHCGSYHGKLCPQVRSVEYYEDGIVRRVEYFGPLIIGEHGMLTPLFPAQSGKVGDKAERPTVKLRAVTIEGLWDSIFLWNKDRPLGALNDEVFPPFPGIAAIQESHPDGLIILGVKIEVVT